MAAGCSSYDFDSTWDCEVLQNELDTTNRKFERACAHVRYLQRTIDDLKKLYRRSVDSGNRAAQYKFKIKLSVTMGIKCYFYDYACEKAQEVAEMRYKLGVLEPGSDDSDFSDDDVGGGGGSDDDYGLSYEDDDEEIAADDSNVHEQTSDEEK